MARTQKQLKATAYHESGHAIAAWIERLAIGRITIVPAGDVMGEVAHSVGMGRYHPEWDNSPQVRVRLERLVRVAFAGPAAQRKFSPRSWRSGHGASDFANAGDHILRIAVPGNHADAYLALLQIEADMLVKQHWRLIAALARALVQRRTMKGAEVKAFILKWYDDEIRRRQGGRARRA